MLAVFDYNEMDGAFKKIEKKIFDAFMEAKQKNDELKTQEEEADPFDADAFVQHLTQETQYDENVIKAVTQLGVWNMQNFTQFSRFLVATEIRTVKNVTAMVMPCTPMVIPTRANTQRETSTAPVSTCTRVSESTQSMPNSMKYAKQMSNCNRNWHKYMVRMKMVVILFCI